MRMLMGRTGTVDNSIERSIERDAEGQADHPVAWFELWAPDLEATLQRVRELGAVVEQHRTNLPSGITMAIIRDRCGNRLGLWAS
jgi:predicted enzyme related to lactoylglutathione lyase